MSALPPKADIETQSRDVRFVPKADIGPSLRGCVWISYSRSQNSGVTTCKPASNASDYNVANSASTGPLQLGLQRLSDPISVSR
jgi:hypothetical protein